MTPARPSVLLYDWDNTLADGWAGISGALNATFDAFGMPSWTIEATKNRVRVALRESFPKMFGDRWKKPATSSTTRSNAEIGRAHV